MLFFGENGYRVIAHDRRGHGKSDQPWDGNNMDRYADDLAELIEKLDLYNLVLVGHSTGGGEVAHYIGRHGPKRVAKVVFVGTVENEGAAPSRSERVGVNRLLTNSVHQAPHRIRALELLSRNQRRSALWARSPLSCHLVEMAVPASSFAVKRWCRRRQSGWRR
jgi:pimeloyl-ACP methyl ester carboxylesterase